MLDLSKMDKAAFAKCLDFVLTRKDASQADIDAAVDTMWKYKFACLYTCSYWTSTIAERLKGLDCEIGVPLDYPFGNSDTNTKIAATKEAVKLGGTALDMCMNVGAIKDHRREFLLYEMKEHVKAAEGNVTKPIIEVGLLTDDEVRFACEIIVEAGATFAKTSSGQSAGLSLEKLLVVKEAIKGSGVKLKGGVLFPKPQNAVNFIRAGADRIGSFEAPMIVDAFDGMRACGIVPPYTGE